ncbi:MAG TPA: cation:proton antiporter [Solirubrobacteraceae bacterium]|nr:cation:proton antiporter [Solirubrobacteraceae bacterium]
MEPIQLAAVLAAVVVVASMVSVELGIAVALLELGLGVVVGNLFSLHSLPWLDFVASFASIVLTFLAGAEVDPDDFRERFGATMAIGVASFIGPFLVAWLVSYGLLGWTLKASLIAGTALSTTSLAVVYAVLVESGLNATTRRQVAHGGVLCHRHGNGDRPVGDLRHAEYLVPGVLAGVGRLDCGAAENRPRGSSAATATG